MECTYYAEWDVECTYYAERDGECTYNQLGEMWVRVIT